MVTLKPISPHQSDVQRLMAALDAYQSKLYPAESNHLDSVEELARENVLFMGAYVDELLTGCGAVKLMDGAYGEIKRLFVDPAYRGRGIARAVMARLEQSLIDRAVLLARLETGVHQIEAIRLYEKLGYVPCEPFGEYRPDPLSLFMEKRLRVGI